jgi:dCTP deaminase
MGVIPKTEIKRRLLLPITDPGSLVITPLLQQDDVLGDSSDADSVDLRLGTYFLLPQVPPLPFTYPSKKSAQQSHVRVHVPLGSYLVVPAHETVLGSTLEFIKLPSDLSGEILTKSSVARTFTVIETAPWIHPSYRGCLTLEIANASNTPLILYPGRLIGQLILMQLLGTKAEERKLSGSYLAPVYPEAPTFRDPKDDLKRIGVSESDIRYPTQPRSL